MEGTVNLLTAGQGEGGGRQASAIEVMWWTALFPNAGEQR